jgi:hypothetical protein
MLFHMDRFIDIIVPVFEISTTPRNKVMLSQVLDGDIVISGQVQDQGFFQGN